MDDEKMDDTSIKMMLDQMGLETKGSGKGTAIMSMVNLMVNKDGELTHWGRMDLSQAPSLVSLFPEGCTIRNCIYDHDMSSDLIKSHKLSELTSHNIKINMFDINTERNVSALDTDVDMVGLLAFRNIEVEMWIFKKISQYTDAVYIEVPYPGNQEYERLVYMSKCPLSTVIINGGLRMFYPYYGSRWGEKDGVKQYLESLYKAKQHGALVGADMRTLHNIKTWLKDNPKTSLIMSPDYAKQANHHIKYEKLYLSPDGEVKATDQLTPKENKLIKILQPK